MAGKKDVEEEVSGIMSKSGAKTVITVAPDGTVQQITANSDQQSSSLPSTEVSSKAKDSRSSTSVEIPTVMLTDKDSKQLISYQHQQQHYFSQPHILSFPGMTTSPSPLKLSIQTFPSLLMGEIFGNIQYPKLWVTKNIIYTYPKGLWGAYFKLNTPIPSQQQQQQPAGETQKPQSPPSQQSTIENNWQMYLIDKRDSSALRLIPAMTIKNRGNQKISTTSTLLQSSEQIYSQTLLKRKCVKYLKLNKEENFRIVHVRD
jgi:hypothetical protein